MPITVLNPIGPARRTRQIGSPAIADLAGVRIAVLDNTKPNAVEIMRRIGQLLVGDYGAASCEVFRKLSSSQGASEQQLRAITADYDLVITGSGDCGSCTSWSALDAAELEHRGVPAVLLVTDPFVPLARTLVQSSGVANLRFAQIPHPIGGKPTDQMVALADQVVESVVSQLKAEVPAA
jgi:hypothetical protein